MFGKNPIDSIYVSVYFFELLLRFYYYFKVLGHHHGEEEASIDEGECSGF
jgi:hypothetical protein